MVRDGASVPVQEGAEQEGRPGHDGEQPGRLAILAYDRLDSGAGIDDVSGSSSLPAQSVMPVAGWRKNVGHGRRDVTEWFAVPDPGGAAGDRGCR